jgi:hypothetical protein
MADQIRTWIARGQKKSEKIRENESTQKTRAPSALGHQGRKALGEACQQPGINITTFRKPNAFGLINSRLQSAFSSGGGSRPETGYACQQQVLVTHAATIKLEERPRYFACPYRARIFAAFVANLVEHMLKKREIPGINRGVRLGEKYVLHSLLPYGACSFVLCFAAEFLPACCHGQQS